MLYESDVIDAVCSKLESLGYQIRQRLETTQQGYDIIAEKGSHQLFIEAKGETSSRKNSERYGRAFSNAQVRVHVSEAFYKAAESISREIEEVYVKAGLALPDTNLHRRHIERVYPVIEKLGIALFWVTPDKKVEIITTWEV